MPTRNFLSLLSVVVISLLCWQTTTTQGARRDEDDEIMELYGTFVDAVEQIKSNYVTDVDRRTLLEAALRGMLTELDPYSSYFDRSQWQGVRRQIEGSFGGVGISVQIDPELNRPKVIAPMVGTPAYDAGVLAGDVILQVDGTPTEGKALEDLIDLMQGPPGSKVKLTVRHPGDDEEQTLEISRAIIEVPSVLGDARLDDDRWDWVVDDEHGIAYIRISSFVQSTPEELQEALDEAIDQGAKAAILDLRNNPGGLLSAAVGVSDLFLERGRIVSTKGRNTPERVYDARPGDDYDLPLAILINDNSASASEIVSACLQDNDRATVVGERSFGKGSVQNIIELEDGTSVLKLTVASYLRPSGENIHRFPDAKPEDEWGVSPNDGFSIEMTDKEELDWAVARLRRDRQLGSARGIGAEGSRKIDEDADAEFQDKTLDEALEYLRDILDPEDEDADDKATTTEEASDPGR